jgi:hypothetical protein
MKKNENVTINMKRMWQFDKDGTAQDGISHMCPTT